MHQIRDRQKYREILDPTPEQAWYDAVMQREPADRPLRTVLELDQIRHDHAKAMSFLRLTR